MPPVGWPSCHNRLASLKESIEGGDSRPTAASYVVFRELSADLGVPLAALKSITDQRIPPINKLLAAAGEKPVVDSH